MSGKILLCGATGNTGRVVAEGLRARGREFVGMVHSDARRRELEARGLEAVHGDFDRPETLIPALSGIDSAYLVCTPDERLIPRELAFIRAAQQVGVRRIVKCSAYGADPNGPSPNLRAHGIIEAELARAGLEYTIIRPHGFMQTFTWFNWSMIEQAGAISLPAGEGGLPLIDLRDVAEVVIRALTEAGHDHQIYDLTGPEVLDMRAQAAILSAELRRPVTYIPGREWQLVLLMKLLGVPATAAEHAVAVFRLQRSHQYERTSSTLSELGIVPTTYQQFVRDLLAGRTGGGSSFAPPSGRVARTLGAALPFVVRSYLRVAGRARPARASPGA